MRSLIHRKWNTNRRICLALVGPTLLLLLGSACLAQTKIFVSPEAIADAANPPLVTLTIKKDGAADSSLTGHVGNVKVGSTPVAVKQDAQGNLTFIPPQKLSGVQPVQLLDSAGMPLQDAGGQPVGTTQLTYPSGDGQDANQAGDPSELSDQRLRLENEEDRRKTIVKEWWFVPLVAAPLIGVLGLFAGIIGRAIRFSKSTFNSPLGLPIGSFRAMVAYTLVAFLGIYVLASALTLSEFRPPDFLLGICATVIGFYFGSRSGEEGSADPKAGTVRGIVRKEGSPASGALVKFKRDDGTEPYSRITDVDGRFELRSARPGKYKVSATLTGAPTSGEEQITVAEGSDHEIEIVIKSANGTVQGTVTLKDGTTAAAGATVELFQANVKKFTATADPTGNYGFKNVSAGNYDIQASLLPNGPSNAAKVTVTASTTQTTDLKLT